MFTDFGPTVGKRGPRREKRGSVALTRHKRRFGARPGSNIRESACTDRISAFGGRPGAAGSAIVQRPARDRRGRLPRTSRIASGKGMVLPLVPAGRGGRHRVLGPYSAPGPAPAAVWDEGGALAGGRWLCRGAPRRPERAA